MSAELEAARASATATVSEASSSAQELETRLATAVAEKEAVEATLREQTAAHRDKTAAAERVVVLEEEVATLIGDGKVSMRIDSGCREPTVAALLRDASRSSVSAAVC